MMNEDRFDVAHGLLLQISLVLNEDLERSLAEQGLTVSRAPVIWHLHHQGPSTQRFLADALKVSARNITGLVDKLEETGFVTRSPHPQDRRATLVSLTKHGQAITAAWERDQRELTRMLFSGLPGHKFDCLVEGLGEILTQLQAAVAMAGKGGQR
jgi:DNA-binding MarR family transcriptional regulator